jgi:ribosomal protein S18 acetylase RimI-like enzyme
MPVTDLTAEIISPENLQPHELDSLWSRAGSFFSRSRFDGGFDQGAVLPVSEADMTPPAGLILVASLHDEPVGCGALKVRPGAPAEIKRMWVAPSARGLGLGRRLLADLEQRAAASGATLIRLETNRSLTAAISMYRGSGYREVAAFNDEPHAHHWFEKAV